MFKNIDLGSQRNLVNRLCLIYQNIKKLAIVASYLNTAGMEQKLAVNFIRDERSSTLSFTTKNMNIKMQE
mgnify:FL=1